jgi:glycine reductase
MLMKKPFKIVHYLNQFFGGIGGEEHADYEVQTIRGAVGPGKGIQNILAQKGVIVSTFICGDNYLIQNTEKVLLKWRDLLTKSQPDIVISGPCFNAGRYGVACATVSMEASKLEIPSITGMYPENPGIEGIKNNVKAFVVKTTDRVSGMNDALEKICKLAIKISSGIEVGSSMEEGYLARGFRKNIFHKNPGYMRAVETLLKKIKGEPFSSEIDVPKFEISDPASPISDMKTAKLALVTEAGLVPKGNPDKLESARATKWLKYSIKNLNTCSGSEFFSLHGGFDVANINEDPCRALPMDAIRILENRKEFKKLHDYYYVTTGNCTTIADSSRFGEEIANELVLENVNGVIFTAT